MSIAQPIAGLEKTTEIPERSTYIVEMGDGSGTRAVTQETLTAEVGKGLKVGDLKNLQTNEKGSLVAAINEAAQSGGSGEQVDILDSKETIEANTTPGKAAGALAVKQMVSELNDNLAHGQIAFTVVNGEPYVKVGADPARPFNSPAYAIFQTERDVSYKAGAVLKLVQHNNFTVNGNTLTCKRAGTYTLRIAGNTKGGGHTATVKTIINGVENKICDLNYVPAIIETSITLKIGDTFCVSITTPTLAAGYAQHMIVLDRS